MPLIKLKNATSVYKGVYKSSSSTGAGGVPLWGCRFSYAELNLNYNIYYTDELWAAHQFNLLIKRHNLQDFVDLNIVDEPVGFVEKIQLPNKSGLPPNIRKEGRKYYYLSCGKSSDNRYDTVDEAVRSFELFKSTNKLVIELKLLTTSIMKNSEGVAFIKMFDGQCWGC